MEKKKKSNLGHWSLAERKILEEGIKNRMTNASISLLVKRTTASIKNEIVKFNGVRNDYNAQSAHQQALDRWKMRADKLSEMKIIPYTEDQIQMIKMGHENGYNIRRISAMCGTSKYRLMSWLKENEDKLPLMRPNTTENRLEALEMIVEILGNSVKKLKQQINGENDV